MSDSILDKIFNNSYPLINKFLFLSATAFGVWQSRSWLSDTAAMLLGSSVIVTNLVFGYDLSKKFWGEKKSKVLIHIENDVKISYTLTTDDTENHLYPIKRTLIELEDDIRHQLGLLLEPSDLLGSEGVAVNDRSIEAYTHRIAKDIIQKHPGLFYLADQHKVREIAFQSEIEELMIEPGEKRKLK